MKDEGGMGAGAELKMKLSESSGGSQRKSGGSQRKSGAECCVPTNKGESTMAYNPDRIRKYTAEYKETAAKMVLDTELGIGDVARKLGIPRTTINK